MTTRTAAGRLRVVAVVVLLSCLGTAPATAHPGEGQTPYRYVVAPPGVTSEGAAESGASAQPIGPAGFAGTTDNQMQLTLPEGVLPPRPGEQAVRVQLDQLDPATLPPLPRGLEPEGNGYRVGLTYAATGAPVGALAAPATLSVSAPAAPTHVLELVDGRWVRLRSTAVAAEAGFSSVVQLDRPITLLQVYDPKSAPVAAPGAPPSAAPLSAAPTGARSSPRVVVPLIATAVLAALVIGLAARHRRADSSA